MIFAIVPWAQVINGPDADSYAWQLDWYFPELAALFLVMSIVVGLIGGLGEKGLTDTLVRGAGDFVGVGLIIVMARGITVIMNNSQITDTVLHSMENAVSDTSNGVFGALMFLVNIPLAFLVPSTSGHAALAMPIMAPLADFAERSAVDRRHGVPVGVRPGQPDHPDVRGRHGWARARQGPLRPVPALHRAAARRSCSCSAPHSWPSARPCKAAIGCRARTPAALLRGAIDGRPAHGHRGLDSDEATRRDRTRVVPRADGGPFGGRERVGHGGVSCWSQRLSRLG